MASKGRGQRRQRRQNSGPPRRSFVFEQGEKALALPAKVTSVTLGSSGEKSVYGSLLVGSPSHLRCLGQRVTVTSPSGEVTFVVGPSVSKAFTYTVPVSDDKGPVLSVVGTAGACVALVYRGSVLYKDR